MIFTSAMRRSGSDNGMNHLLLVNYQMMKKNGASATSARQSMLKSDW
jgi:hypothetical protein